MKNNDNEKLIQDKMRDLLEKPPEKDISEAKIREFTARLYKTSDERKSLVDFPLMDHLLSKRSMVATVSALCLIASFTFLFSPIYPTVSNVKGTVKVYRASRNEWIFANSSNSIKLAKGDILKTFSDGQADLIIPKLYHIRLKSDSEIKLAKVISRAVSGDIGYTLTQGKVFTHYNKYRRIGKTLSIDTPQAEASALGTDFMVASMPMMDRTVVGVLDGVVKVGSLGLPRENVNTVFVRAGERTIVSQGSTPSKPSRLMEDELLEMEELYSIGIRPQVALLISTGPTRTRELLSGMPLYISTERRGALPERIEKIAKSFSQAMRERSKEKHIESVREFEDIVNKYPNPKYDVQFLLFIGAYYEYIGEDQMAINTFERIVRDYPASSLMSMAQCAIGIIYEEKLKDNDKARSVYQKVISNYPNSPEVEEASAGLSRLTK